MEAVEGKVRRTRGVHRHARPAAAAGEVMRWNLTATPGRRSGTARRWLRVGNELAIETLTLAHEGITRDQKGASTTPAPAAG